MNGFLKICTRRFGATNDLFMQILIIRKHERFQCTVPSSAVYEPIEFSGERTIASFNSTTAAARTGNIGNSFTDQLWKFVLFQVLKPG